MLNSRPLNTEVVNGISPPSAGGVVISFRQSVGYPMNVGQHPQLATGKYLISYISQTVVLQSAANAQYPIVFRQQVANDAPVNVLLKFRQVVII